MTLRITILGLLAVCPIAIAFPSAEEHSVSFEREVLPVLQKKGCSAGKCHGSFSGRGELQFSLFASDPTADFESLVLNGRGRRVNTAAPEHSLMLLKPTGEIPHEGGAQIETGSPAYEVLRRWIAAGARSNPEDTAKVTRLELDPAEIIIADGKAAALRVRAHWTDGQSKDVTEWALYDARETAIAEVDEGGRVTAIGPGRTSITVSFLGAVSAATVSVPHISAASVVTFQPENYIDEIIAAEWKKMNLSPAPVADDAEFLRRAHVDVIGTLPTPDEIRAFLGSADPDKRANLIDGLLERPEYIDYWTLKWGDLLRVHRRFLGDKGMWSFHGWIRDAVRENRPIDAMTRQLLTAKGNLYSNGATGFFFVDAKPEELAETTAQVFLGMRMQCARCHHHPMESWSQEDYHGLANFFTRIQKKDNGDGGRFGGAKLIRTSATVPKDMRPKMPMNPRAFGDVTIDDPENVGDVRQPLADWITSKDNPFFARSFANRFWSYFMDRGLVEPVDDLRATNPASMPALLDALEHRFVSSGYDAKALIRDICTSRVYQLASEVSPARDTDGMFYTHHAFQRLPAQVLADAIDQATGVATDYKGLPPGTRAIQIPDPAVVSVFLNQFGRSTRANPCECASTTNPDLAQALQLLNSDELSAKISQSSGRLRKLLDSELSDEAIIEELYLRTLSRPPTSEERELVSEKIAAAPDRAEGFQDLLWALLNATRFVFQH